MKARLLVRFTVAGVAQPRGSKTVGKCRDGRAFIRDDNPQSRAWMTTVAKVARHAMQGRQPIDCPVVLQVTIYRTRPASHYGAKGISHRAPAYPATKPDLTKCIRGIEDAMNGIVWTDDSRVVEQRTLKAWGDRSEVVVAVYMLPTSLAERSAWIAAETQGVLSIS